MFSLISNFQDILHASKHDPTLGDVLRRHIHPDDLPQILGQLERFEADIGAINGDVNTTKGETSNPKGPTYWAKVASNLWLLLS